MPADGVAPGTSASVVRSAATQDAKASGARCPRGMDAARAL